MLNRLKELNIVKKIILTAVLGVFMHSFLNAESIPAPVKAKEQKEIRMDVFNMAGSSMAALNKSLDYSIGECGGIRELSAGGIVLDAGYPLMDIYEPYAITDLVVESVGGGDVSLTWSSPGDDGLAGELNGAVYRIRWATSSALDWTGNWIDNGSWDEYSYKYSQDIATSGVQALSERKIIAEDLEDNVTYFFSIWTRDEEHNWSNQSNMAYIFFDVPPAAITSLAAIPYDKDGAIQLSWVSPGSNGFSETLQSGSEYKIQYSTYDVVWSTSNAQLTLDASGRKPYVDYDTELVLSNETTYYFHMWTKDEENLWSDISNTATSWCRIKPAAVVDLDAAVDEAGVVRLTWTAPGDDGNIGDIFGGRYRIRWSTANIADWIYGDDWDEFEYKYNLEEPFTASQGLEVLKTITGLAGGATYYFHLWTRDEDAGDNSDPLWSGNWSEMSNLAQVRITHQVKPQRITDLVAVSTDYSAFGTGQVDLSWTAPSTKWDIVIKKYQLHWSDVPLTGNATSWWNSSNEQIVRIRSNPGESVEYRLSDLIPAATYYFAVKAVDDFDNVADYDTSLDALDAALAKASWDNIPPAPITSLTALTGDALGVIRLFWSSPGDDGYENHVFGKYKIRWTTGSIPVSEWESDTWECG